MKIAVNTRFLLKNALEGIGWFTYETMKRITQSHPEHQFYFLFDRKFSSEFIFNSNIHPVVIYPPARHPLLWYVWFEYSLNKVLKNLNADLFISPDGYIPLKSNVKTLSVIHDLNFEYYPDSVSYTARIYYKKYFPLFAKKSTRIATVSESSKIDISNLYNIPVNKIDVVYNGGNECYTPADEHTKQITRKQFTQGCEYLLYIGGLHARKNVKRLVQAFNSFKKESDSKIKLMIVGRKDWVESGFWAELEKLEFKDDIIFSGGIYDPIILKNILASALAMVYVSYFEGFGIPLIEAMYAEIPVVTSNVSCMPEIAGDAALFTDPFSVNSISDALKKICFDKKLREELIEKGKIHRKLYSWDKTALKLWESINKAIKTN